MGFDLSFDYVASLWRIHYWEESKTSIHATGKTLTEAIDNLKNHALGHQLRLWLYCR